MQTGVAIVESDPAVECVMELHFGSGKTVSSRLRMDLQAVAVPLDDVVIADDAIVGEATDPL